MKRKIFGILMASTLLFAVGCEKKNEEKKDEDKTPKIICTSSEESEGIKSSATTTITVRDDKKYVKEYVSEIKMVVDNESMYNLYKEAMNEEELDKDEDVEYTYKFDDANKTIYTTLKVSLTDKQIEEASEEEKVEMEAKSLIERAEKSGVKCDFKNITRGDLGL